MAEEERPGSAFDSRRDQLNISPAAALGLLEDFDQSQPIMALPTQPTSIVTTENPVHPGSELTSPQEGGDIGPIGPSVLLDMTEEERPDIPPARSGLLEEFDQSQPIMALPAQPTSIITTENPVHPGSELTSPQEGGNIGHFGPFAQPNMSPGEISRLTYPQEGGNMGYFGPFAQPNMNPGERSRLTYPQEGGIMGHFGPFPQPNMNPAKRIRLTYPQEGGNMGHSGPSAQPDMISGERSRPAQELFEHRSGDLGNLGSGTQGRIPAPEAQNSGRETNSPSNLRKMNYGNVESHRS
ncbi:hypothetical protein AAL_07635 [Moelleriella libera RCEF 2490]|uniref:Uncharacterized protein n=1 Tax=Moelleriella libera RCEF 2490 TaxID=1081109 RepID=A0A167X7Y3_9HYPO|nr:hypothetical protein AAL_07635 [Moelleriella libera RCEF 2490]